MNFKVFFIHIYIYIYIFIFKLLFLSSSPALTWYGACKKWVARRILPLEAQSSGGPATIHALYHEFPWTGGPRGIQIVEHRTAR